MQFDSNRAPQKGEMIRYFQKSLNPLIKVEKKPYLLEFNSFNEIIKKAVDAKAKIAFKPFSHTGKTDQQCAQDSCLAIIKSYPCDLLMKDPKAKKSKFRNSKPRL